MAHASPTLSVLIPAFNAERFVERAIQSALRQTRQPDEIVVVDDGSRDATAALTSALARVDSRIKLISQENGGLSNARNRGISEASGDFIALLDADDLWHRQHLEFVFRAIARDPSTTWISTDWQPFTDGETPVESPIPDTPSARYDYFLYAAYRNRLLPSATIIARSALLEVGGFPGDVRRSAEDKICWARLASAGHHVHRVDVKTCLYRQHGASISSTEFASRDRLDTLADRHLRVQAATLAAQPSAARDAFLRGMALRTLASIPVYGGTPEHYEAWRVHWGRFAGAAGGLLAGCMRLRPAIASSMERLLRGYLRLAAGHSEQRALVATYR